MSESRAVGPLRAPSLASAIRELLGDELRGDEIAPWHFYRGSTWRFIQ
jgi:DNA-binding transcriptional regulator YdaS (Cro superfamily)